MVLWVGADVSEGERTLSVFGVDFQNGDSVFFEGTGVRLRSCVVPRPADGDLSNLTFVPLCHCIVLTSVPQKYLCHCMLFAPSSGSYSQAPAQGDISFAEFNVQMERKLPKGS
jgi:hypothetical protein